MPTYRENCNAPIICHSVEEVEEAAVHSHAQLLIAEDDVGLINTVVDASKSGRWVCVLCANVSNAVLREVVYQVWLKGTWAHHAQFRAWFVDARFSAPPKEELLHGFGAPKLRDGAVPDPSDEDPQERINKQRLPSLLVSSAVYLQYANNFDDEFLVRELVTAVSGLELYRTEETRKYVSLLQPQDLVDLFRLATREDVMIALCGRGEEDEKDRLVLISARDRDGRSPLDIAVEKDFKKAAVLLRNLGCRSETFKFERLLDPNFQPMLKELIDPWKPFPFDPVKSLQKVALGGQASILRKLFYCRVDVDFGFEQYPIAEACESGCDDVAWIVVDRMSATGVNPFRDPQCASYHLVRTLMYCFDHPTSKSARKSLAQSLPNNDVVDEAMSALEGKAGPTRSRSSFQSMEPLSDTALWVLLKVADVCIDDGKRINIPLPALCRGEKFAKLMEKLLLLVDPKLEKDSEGLLEFFISFDPNNELARQLTKKTITDIGEGGGANVEDNVYRLVWEMIRQGERAVPMTHWAVELVAFRQYFPFTFRGHGGETIIMKALNSPPNVGALESILRTIPKALKEKAMEQPDLNGNNPLKRLVVQLTQDPDAFSDYMVTYGDCVRLLLDHGMSYRVAPPEFTDDLFTLAAREELGDIAYELLPTRTHAGSIILGCSTNTLALMWRRHRRLQRFPIKPRVFASIFDEGETKWRAKKGVSEKSTATDVYADGEEDSYVTNIVDTTKAASAILTVEEKKAFQRFEVDAPPPSAPSVATMDARVEKARRPHPTFGDNILTLLDLEVLAHICSFAKLIDLKALNRVSVSWYYASLFDNVWIDRQVTELYSKSRKFLRSMKQHAASIVETSGNPTKTNATPPALDFIHGSHSLESCRNIFIMHVSEQWQR